MGRIPNWLLGNANQWCGWWLGRLNGAEPEKNYFSKEENERGTKGGISWGNSEAPRVLSSFSHRVKASLLAVPAFCSIMEIH